MEVLIKYCINSFAHVDQLFDTKFDYFLCKMTNEILFQNQSTNRKRTVNKQTFEFV